jgi:uncharacterized protein (DUF302 family)
MVTKRSKSDFPTTVKALDAAIETRGLAMFAKIDHAAGAAEAGLELDDEVVVLLGSPRAGTPLMQADRRDAYELAGHESTLDQRAALLETLVAEASRTA